MNDCPKQQLGVNYQTCEICGEPSVAELCEKHLQEYRQHRDDLSDERRRDE